MALDIDQRNSQPQTRRRPVRSDPSISGVATERPRFARFAAAMAEARAGNAPQFALDRDLPEHDVPLAATGASPRPRAAKWRAPRRPVAPWFGIASCALLFGLLLSIVPLPPIGAEIERLIGPWLEWPQDPEVAAPPIDQAPQATLEPTAGREEPPRGSIPVVPPSMPLVADQGPDAAAGPDPAPAAEEPAARSVPVPTLKPPLTQP